jgi:hypothetical protein
MANRRETKEQEVRLAIIVKKLRITFLLAEGGALLFRPPTTAADLFTNAKVNN